MFPKIEVLVFIIVRVWTHSTVLLRGAYGFQFDKHKHTFDIDIDIDIDTDVDIDLKGCTQLPPAFVRNLQIELVLAEIQKPLSKESAKQIEILSKRCVFVYQVVTLFVHF